MLINTMEEESLSEGMVSQITVEYKMFGSDKMELMEGIGRAIRHIYYGVCGMLMKNPYFLTKENYSPVDMAGTHQLAGIIVDLTLSGHDGRIVCRDGSSGFGSYQGCGRIHLKMKRDKQLVGTSIEVIVK